MDREEEEVVAEEGGWARARVPARAHKGLWRCAAAAQKGHARCTRAASPSRRPF